MEHIDIDKLAQLARLDIPTDEKEELKKDVSAILGYVTQIQSVEVDEESSTNVGSVYNRLREDINPHESGLYTNELMKEVPHTVSKDGETYVSVKKIL